jgi:hypothetical protein
MAYSAGDTILDDEYNAFANSSSDPFGLNHIGGTGSTIYGLGEATISAVSAGATVTASQWNTLFTAMGVIAGHTGDSLTSTTAVSSGDAIAIKAALIADLATLAASVAAGSPSTSNLTTSGTLQSPASSSTWYGSFTTEVTATFANANKMRHFFNAGGKIRIDPVRTGNGQASATGKDSEWDAIYNAVGNFDIAATTCTRSGTGETQTTFANTTGFHDLSTGYTTLLHITSDSYPYTSNSCKIEAKLNAAVGTATIMTIKITSTDGAADYTYEDGTTPYRNGQHEHRLISINTTTGSLTNAHAPSGTGVASNTTT